MSDKIKFLLVFVLVAILAAPGLRPAFAQEEHLHVGVDIKPGSIPNAINLKSNGSVPVALLGSADFDVSSVDLDTVKFGKMHEMDSGAPALRSALEDVGLGDKKSDIIQETKTDETRMKKRIQDNIDNEHEVVGEAIEEPIGMGLEADLIPSGKNALVQSLYGGRLSPPQGLDFCNRYAQTSSVVKNSNGFDTQTRGRSGCRLKPLRFSRPAIVCARVELSARRAPRCRIASPQWPILWFTKAVTGSIFRRCVHQRKVRLGGG